MMNSSCDHGLGKESFHGIDVAAIAKHFPDSGSALCGNLSCPSIAEVSTLLS